MLLTIIGISFIFFATTLGSSIVFLMKKEINKNVIRISLGLSAGVMIASSIWSLLIPSIDRAKEIDIVSWLPATIGFILGVFFLLGITKITKKQSIFIAVTTHNIPEGMAVGLAFGSAFFTNSPEQMVLAFGLAIGIGVQNIPEGMAIALPYTVNSKNKKKGFIMGTLSGSVEPLFAIIAFLLSNYLVFAMPWLLSFAAGAMIYVTIVEILPEAHDEDNNIVAISFSFGFLLMMILDVALG